MKEKPNTKQQATGSKATAEKLSPPLAVKLQNPNFAIPVLSVVILVLIGLAGWYFESKQIQTATPGGVINYSRNNDNSQPPVQNPPAPLVEGSYFPAPILENSDPNKPPTPNTAVQWSGPKLTDDLKLIFAQDGPLDPESTNKILYYNMGMHGSNKIVMAEAPAVDPSGPADYFFEQTSKGYIFISKVSNYNIYHNSDNPGAYALSPTIVGADTKTYYQGIIGPAKLNWSGLTMEQPYLAPQSLFKPYLAQEKQLDNFVGTQVATIAQGNLYLFQRTESNDNGTGGSQKFYTRRYVLELPSGLYTPYNINYAFFSDDGVPKITWADNTKNKDQYRADGGGGCGNPGAYITSADDLTNRLKVAGTTSTSETIYEFSSMSDPTLKYYYDQQNGHYYDQDKQESVAISLADWYKHHPVIAYKNALGDYVIMTNNAYGLAAECGKPVVYLYPTQPTNVSVKVGADISVSEPAYNNGWNVLAQPNGSLTTNGRIYDSLFWEGLGHGDYPSITEGFVVPRNQVDSTVTTNLKQLGLNDKEAQDFKDFWMAKMPNTPFVRLTWFTTAQLDRLAPLYISPKPDTVIRVFLDFQGLSAPTNIPQQHLSALPRKGFTVIEWGGLLKK